MDYPDWITEAENLYKQKYSFTKIDQILNVNRKNVSYYLQAKGYEPNHKFMPKNKVIQKTQKALNQNVFEVIDNEEKAYWLGVLNHLYKDSVIYLERKYNRYLEYCRLEPKLQKTQDN